MKKADKVDSVGLPTVEERKKMCEVLYRVVDAAIKTFDELGKAFGRLAKMSYKFDVEYSRVLERREINYLLINVLKGIMKRKLNNGRFKFIKDKNDR